MRYALLLFCAPVFAQGFPASMAKVPDSETVETTPPVADTADWATRSTAPGVLQAIGFDRKSDVTRWRHGDHKAVNVSWRDGAIRFDVKKGDSANSGNWRIFLSKDQREFKTGDEFYVSYRQYFPEYYVRHKFNGGGWKQSIISRNDSEMNGVKQDCRTHKCGSNQLNELVLGNAGYRQFPQGYNRTTNGSYVGWHVPAKTGCSSTDFIYQNAVDRGAKKVGNPCENSRAQFGGFYSYKTPHPDPLTGAWTFPVDEWASFKIWVKLGKQGVQSSDTQLKVWAARDGEDWDLIIDRRDLELGGGPPHNAIWFLPYDTGKTPNPARQDTYTLYDELIVSLNDIAAPLRRGNQ